MHQCFFVKSYQELSVRLHSSLKPIRISANSDWLLNAV